MPDTERYARWVEMLAASDAVLVQLAVIAASAVLVWEWLRAMPAPWRAWLRLIFCAAALVAQLQQLALAGQLEALRPLAVAVFVAAGVALTGIGFQLLTPREKEKGQE